MRLRIDKAFDKDFKKARNTNHNKKLLSILKEIESANNLSDISNIKKLRGTSGFYIESVLVIIGLALSRRKMK